MKNKPYDAQEIPGLMESTDGENSLNGSEDVNEETPVVGGDAAKNLFVNSVVAESDKSSKRWYDLGLSTSSAPAFRVLLKQSAPSLSSKHRVEKNVRIDEKIDDLRKTLVSKNVLDTFICYSWFLRVLAQSSSSYKETHIRISDVLLFENGDPKYWIFTKQGSAESRTFLPATALGNSSLWERFLKSARQAAGVSKDDFLASVCIKYSLSVEGVVGEYINMNQLKEFSRADSVERFQVVGLQVHISPKCGNLSWRKSIIYKTQVVKNLPGQHITIKHTKEYEMFESKWDSHMSNSVRVPDHLCQKADSNTGSGLVPLNPYFTQKHSVVSKSLNRSTLGEFTLRALKQIESVSGLCIYSLRCHFIVDVLERIWLVGVSKVLPFQAQPARPMAELEPKLLVPSQQHQKAIDLPNPSKTVFQDCISALTTPVAERKSSVVQCLFDFSRGSHFVSSIPPGLYFRLCHSMEYKFVEKGFEIYYAGDSCEEMYIILAGSVRLLLEPLNDMYCRTVDLTDKDAFGEQAITRPGSKMQSQAIATEDSHLIVIKRQAVDQVLDKGKSNAERWRMKKPQLIKCRKLFCLEPRERTEFDLRTAVQCTNSIYFFQNLPQQVHYDLCSVARYMRFEKQQTLFDHPGLDPKSSEKATWSFYLVLSGRIRWEYSDRLRNPVHEDISEGGHALSIGKCHSLESPCEVLVVQLNDWERSAHGRSVITRTDAEIEDNRTMSGTFMTELDAKEDIIDLNSTHLFTVTGCKTRSSRISLKTKLSAAEKLLTCAVTGDKFPASQRKFLRWRQIRSTAEHLEKRKVHFRGFDLERWRREPPSRLMLLDNLIVSPSCYDTYISEKNMEDQERVFASLMLNGSAPPFSQRILPPAGCTEFTTKLLLCAMFLEIIDIECPASLASLGRNFDLRFCLCEQWTQIHFDANNSAEVIATKRPELPLNKVRVCWFFCSDEGISLYLKCKKNMELSLFESTGSREVAKAQIDFSALGDKVAVHQKFRTKLIPTSDDASLLLAAQFLFLNLNFGCIPYRCVDVSNFRLRRRHGLFLPTYPFITESLPPEGWDPCNEEYIAKMLAINKVEIGPVLSLDGKLIPTGPTVEPQEIFMTTNFISSSQTYRLRSYRKLMDQTSSDMNGNAHGKNRREASQASVFTGRKHDYVVSSKNDSTGDKNATTAFTISDIFGNCDSSLRGKESCLERHNLQFLCKEGSYFQRDPVRLKPPRRPLSAMARLTGSPGDKEKKFETLLSGLTRPSSALEPPKASPVDFRVTHCTNSQPAYKISAGMSRRSENKKGNGHLNGLNMAQQLWPSNLTEIDTLDHNLKSLDSRMMMISIRENLS